MVSKIKNALTTFQPITLTELNAQASFLERIDRKFLLTSKQLSEILKKLKENFKVLEIGGEKVFSYDNVYMDTEDYLFYHQHQNKEKSRTKVRTRLYKDSNIAFFEYKQKNNNITSKYRYEFNPEEHGIMTKGKKRFFEGVWMSMYGSNSKAPKLSPAIKTEYKRITLVNKDGAERLTIDFDIKTSDLRDLDTKETNLKNLVIVESKTLNQSAKSIEIINASGIKQAKSCSKYGLGIVYSGLAKKYDTFKKTIEEIEKIKKEIN